MNNSQPDTTTIRHKYLYILRSKREFKELCKMEMKSLFLETTNERFHLTNRDIPISRSGFIHSRITVLYTANSLKELEYNMLQDHLYYDGYKIHFISIDKVPYAMQITSMRAIGYTIEGDFELQNPKVEFAITKVQDIWYFGYYHKNLQTWLERRNKPYNYSNALDVIVAKALINIAINNNTNLRLVDPCCGIGTVIIEARVMGIFSKGYEINPFIKTNCNLNLEYFGFEGDVELLDMHDINESFDVAVLDLPYGQFSLITKEQQLALIQKTQTIAKRAIIISMDEITSDIKVLGYNIIDSCQIRKSNVFSRYVYICET